jgi:hypothetical protein
VAPTAPAQRLYRTKKNTSFDVMAISRADALCDIANLGITPSEARLLLVQVQQPVVADQATALATFRPNCRSCSGTCHVKDWQSLRIATLFGEVRVIPGWCVRAAVLARVASVGITLPVDT